MKNCQKKFDLLQEQFDQLKLNSVHSSKVQSLEVNFLQVCRIVQSLSDKFSSEIEKQGKEIVDKVMDKIIKSGGMTNHDQTVREIINDLKDLKMTNQYILEVIDKLENDK